MIVSCKFVNTRKTKEKPTNALKNPQIPIVGCIFVNSTPCTFLPSLPFKAMPMYLDVKKIIWCWYIIHNIEKFMLKEC